MGSDFTPGIGKIGLSLAYTCWQDFSWKPGLFTRTFSLVGPELECFVSQALLSVPHPHTMQYRIQSTNKKEKAKTNESFT